MAKQTSTRPCRRYTSGVHSNVTWITVVETRAYLARAKGRLTEAEREAVIEMLAEDPDRGDVIPGGGGVRKVRIEVTGRGKRGGARVIYYFHNESMPVFLLSVYTKAERISLSRATLNAMAKMAKALRVEYGRKR